MRTWIPFALALCTLGATADEASTVTWDYEGYPQILEAAATAKRTQRRILLGLSGADT